MHKSGRESAVDGFTAGAARCPWHRAKMWGGRDAWLKAHGCRACSMGPKITVDSATLMNKGLEVIEAHYLFGAAYDNIDIVIHPQSIIHSMVETVDSSVLAQVPARPLHTPVSLPCSPPSALPGSTRVLVCCRT